MSEEFNPGDVVEVTYRAKVHEDGTVFSLNALRSFSKVTDVKAVLVKPADDPEDDKAGTVRTDAKDGAVFVKIDHDFWEAIGSDYSGRLFRQQDVNVRGSKKTGVVPGSPADINREFVMPVFYSTFEPSNPFE